MISYKKQKIYIVGFCTLATAIMILLAIRNNIISKKERDKNARYTIGTTVRSIWAAKQSSPYVYYKYQVKFVDYERSNTYNVDLGIKIKGGHYVVRFSSKDPENAEILLELGEVPDSVAYPLYFSSCDTLPKW